MRCQMNLSSSDLKKLKRAAIEPARVFARRDFDPTESRPVLHFAWLQNTDSGVKFREFYSPHFPTWMFEAGDDLHVIDKAIERYGLEEAPVNGKWYEFAEFLFDIEAGIPILLPDPEYKQMKNGAQVAFYYVGRKEWVAATPIVYAQRR